MKNKLIDVGLLILGVLLLTAASPGFELSFLAFVAFVPLLFVIRRQNLPGWLSGLLFGFLYFLVNLSWLVKTVSHFGSTPVVLGIIALIAFALYLSLYYAVFGYLVSKKSDNLILPMVFVVLEVVKSYALTGFPWLNLGLTQYNNSLLLPLVSLMGEYGLSFLIILLNFLIYDSLVNRQKMTMGLTAAVIILMVGTGMVMPKLSPESLKQTAKVDIIQPSYNQLDKWVYQHKNRIMDRVMLRLEDSIFNDSDMVILPEAVFPAFIEKEPELFAYLKELSKVKPIMFGSLRNETRDNVTKNYNSVYYLSQQEVSIYDKRHLVPFGEYFPFGDIFKPISYYFFGEADDFSSGSEASVFQYHTDNVTLGPLVCFESTFTDIVQTTVANGADTLVVLTNDSWFGGAFGQRQHLAVSAMRAAETGKPIIRATQSGISACIDNHGQIQKTLATGVAGTLRCETSFTEGMTVFSRYQYGWILFLIGIVVYRRVKEKKSESLSTISG